MDHDFEIVKERLKELARKRKMTLKEIYSHFGISQAGFDKSIKSPNFPYSRRIYEIAELLECSITDILEGSEALNVMQIGNSNENYGTRIDKNNFFSGSNEELIKLRTENEQLKTIIDKQDKEIEFLRGQLMK